MTNNIYDKITGQIIELLQNNNLSWIKGWRTETGAYTFFNRVTKKPYHGMNWLLLNIHASRHGYTSPHYLTFKQCHDLGGQILKGSKGQEIIFFTIREIEEEVKTIKEGQEVTEKKIKKYPIIRGYYVFNLQQTDLYKPESKPEGPIVPALPVVEQCEAIITGYTDKPTIEENGGIAFYSPIEDKIGVPKRALFATEGDFYSTLFHEMAHSTGHSSRLDRAQGMGNIFGDKRYSEEEVTAELASTFLCAHGGIENSTINNNAAYIDHWIKAMREDNRFIFHVVSAARKAAEYVLKSNKKEEA